VNTFFRKAALSFALASLMVMTSFVVLGSAPTAAEQAAVNGDVARSVGYVGGSKIDSGLMKDLAESDGPFEVYVVVSDKEMVNELLVSKGLSPIKAKEFPGIQLTSLMTLDKETVLALANSDAVTSILAYEKPMVDSYRVDLAKEETAAIAALLPEDIDVDEVHGAVAAWEDGYTGETILLADIDDGFDMAHPDLQGQQARYEFGTYAGWPICYDDYAANQWASGSIGGGVVDTSTEVAVKNSKYVKFDGTKYLIKGLTDADGNALSSQSGVVHMGYSPDWTLELLWGGSIAVLVVDSQVAGVYDTVYVDVTRDFDFTNDKACVMGDEISYFDAYDASTGKSDFSAWNAGDGYADYSGGMVYWISDGVNVYPASDWTYGADFVADSGDAVAFMGAYAGTHGTMTSSAALANGYTYGGQLEGMAPGAKLIAIPFTGSTVNAWLFAQYGVDGILGTGDEADIVTNSYGWSDTTVAAGYQLIDMIATTISMSGPTLWFWSSGNGGPGYGTVHSVTDYTSVHVGAGTTMQYRGIMGYEPAGNAQWGDVAPFSNSGPGRNGKLNSEIIASGMYSMEPAPLNYDPSMSVMVNEAIGNGYRHSQLGSGTSHATPTAAGGAALGYQAYKLANEGAMPAKDYAKAVLLAAADDMHFDPFKQGTGWLNAKTFTDAMSGAAGVVSTTQGALFTGGVVYPGDVYGQSYEMFPNFMLPGQEAVQGVTSSNFGTEDADVVVSPEILLKTGSDTLNFVTKPRSDIFVDITAYVPADTDLLEVTMYIPYEQTDPEQDYVQNVEYWLELHDWADLNGNGAVGKTTGNWELFRYSVDGSQCNANQIMLKDPIERTTDGLIVRIRAIAPMMGIEVSLQLDYYELDEFPWAEVRAAGTEEWSSSLTATVPAGGQLAWELLVSVPDDAYVGSYGAAVYIDDGERIQCLPIVIHVPAQSYEFEFGGESYFDTPYNNEVTGVTDKFWRFEVGDWRIFWSLPTEMPDPNAYLMACVEWTDLPTDINIHVLAPVATDPESEWQGVFDDPYGPGYYETGIASSDERYMGAGIFGSWTNTGGPKEAIAAPLGAYETAVGSPAPFAIVTRCPLISGDAPTETLQGYTKMIVLNGLEPSAVELELDISDGDPLTGSIPAWFDVTIDGEIAASGGSEDPTKSYQWDSVPIYQGVLGSDFESDLANADYTMPIYVESAAVLKVSVWEVSDCPDIDMGVWYDANEDGIASLNEPYWYVGAGGSDESLTLRDVADGTYLVKVLGYTVVGNPGYFGLNVQIGVEGTYITATGIAPLVSSGLYSFSIDYGMPAIPGTYVGAATFGFLGSSSMFRIEVLITVVE